MTIVPDWPKTFPRHLDFDIAVDGAPVPTLSSDRGAFAQWLEAEARTVEVQVTLKEPASEATIRPRRLGIEPQVSGHTLRFSMSVPARVLVEVPGLPLLCLFAEAPPAAAPVGARRLAPGQVHDLGLVQLEDGQHLDVPPGAVLRGRVELRGHGASVGGGGIIDGSTAPGLVYSVVTDKAHHAMVRDLTIVNPSHWMVVVGGSTDVELSNLRLLGDVGSSDGIDIVGSSRVRASHCFIINGDDCLVVKSMHKAYTTSGGFSGWALPVRDVIFEHCVVGNFRGGSATEIGHELQCEIVEDVTFRELDVLFVHQYAAVFSMHNADRALVRRVRWEGVYIEHCFDKLIDFRIVESHWGRDLEHGRAEALSICNVDWWPAHYNSGHTVSVIGGLSEQHRVDDVSIENFRIHGERVSALESLDIFTRHARGLTLR